MLTLAMALAFFALLTAPKRGYKTSEIPAAERHLFDVAAGRLYYKRPVAEMILAGLLGKTATPTEVPSVLVVAMGDKPIMGADEWGAYWAIQGLHAQGSDIWVPVNMHLPTVQPQPVVYLPQGSAPPERGYARLIGAGQLWPMLPSMPPLA